MRFTEARRIIDDRNHATINERCKTLQDERFQSRIFYTARKDDRKDIFENYLCVDKNEERSIMEILKNNKYARLEILTVFPYAHHIVVPEFED